MSKTLVSFPLTSQPPLSAISSDNAEACARLLGRFENRVIAWADPVVGVQDVQGKAAPRDQTDREGVRMKEYFKI